MIKRHPLLSLMLIAVLVLLGLAWQNRVHLAAFPDVPSAYAAKEYCSCRYVMENSAEYCQGYAQLPVPLSGFVDDAANKQVSASALGRSNTATWLGARQGCRLVGKPPL